MGGDSITETHISTLTDSIILLRYVEMFGEMRRGLTVLKMRGSRARQGDPRVHDRQGRACTSAGRSGTSPAFSPGAPVHVSPGDVERAWTEFDRDTARQRAESGSIDDGADELEVERRRISFPESD